MSKAYIATQEGIEAVNKAIREIEEIISKKSAEGSESASNKSNVDTDE